MKSRARVTPWIARALPCAAVAIAAACSSPDFARAGWPPGGTQITSGFQSVLSRFGAATDDAGGAFVAWSGQDSIRVVHVLINGTLAEGWPAGGRSLCAVPVECDVRVSPDGAGGLFIAFVPGFYTGDHDLRVVRMGPDGSIAPGWPGDGLLISSTPGAKLVTVGPDGFGGAGVFWQDRTDNIPFSGAHSDFYATRLSPDGAIWIGWPAGGRAVKVAPASVKVQKDYFHHLIPDGSGGFFLAWSDSFGVSYDLYVQRLTGTGAIASGWPAGGRTACSVLSDKRPAGYGDLGSSLIPDGAGGVFVGWNEFRGPGLHGFVMRIDGQGQDAPGWPADGLAPFPIGLADILFGLDADGAGGAVLGYEFYHLDEGCGCAFDRIAVCRIGPDGVSAAGWPGGGATVSDSMGFTPGLWIASDGAGGARVLWGRSGGVIGGESQPSASHVTSTGAIAAGWPASGKPVTPTVSDRSSLRVVPDLHGGEIVLWLEQGTPPYEIWGQRLSSDGAPTTGVPGPGGLGRSLAAAPNPFSARVRLSFTLSGGGPCDIVVRDITGRSIRTLAHAALEPGRHDVEWDGFSDGGVRQPPGVYVVVARGPGLEARRRVVRLR